MKRYFLTIAICIIVGLIISYIFNTEPTSEVAFLVACCALDRCCDKEE